MNAYPKFWVPWLCLSWQRFLNFVEFSTWTFLNTCPMRQREGRRILQYSSKIVQRHQSLCWMEPRSSSLIYWYLMRSWGCNTIFPLWDLLLETKRFMFSAQNTLLIFLKISGFNFHLPESETDRDLWSVSALSIPGKHSTVTMIPFARRYSQMFLAMADKTLSWVTPILGK